MTRRACLGIGAPFVTACARREAPTVRMLTFIGGPYQSLVESLAYSNSMDSMSGSSRSEVVQKCRKR
jgi:hypothetical protein